MGLWQRRSAEENADCDRDARGKAAPIWLHAARGDDEVCRGGSAQNPLTLRGCRGYRLVCMVAEKRFGECEPRAGDKFQRERVAQFTAPCLPVANAGLT